MEDDLPGRQLDEYRLEALLGQGGMARVYRGLDTRLHRYAAIKVIDASFRSDSEYALRFEREAQAIAQLEHPHIVRLYRYGEADGMRYIAMQYIEGADLGFVLTSYRSDGEYIEPDDARRIIREVCLALDYAHSRGVIHRDVKPSNIMLDKQGRAILTDFGLALLTEVGTRGQILGSPHYVAPEQAISSAKAVPQSDLYAVGVILYEMFTGQLPFEAEEPMDVALLHIGEPPRPPRALRSEISLELEAVILKCLAKEPAERYPNGAALAEALDQALRLRTVPEASAYPVTKPHASIAERVGLELAEHPLPPLPAAVAETSPPPTTPERTPASRRPLILMSAGVGALAVILAAAVCGLLVARFAFGSLGTTGNLPSQASPKQTALPVSQATISEPLPTFTLGASPTLSLPLVADPGTPTASPISTDATASTALPTDTPAPLPSPTPTPASYELLLVKDTDENSVILVNRSALTFPLGLLRLGDGQGAIRGMEWAVDGLASGECVSAWKDRRERDLPKGLTCTVIGERLVREGRDRFWKETFAVYYNDVRIGTCEKDQAECPISISP